MRLFFALRLADADSARIEALARAADRGLGSGSSAAAWAALRPAWVPPGNFHLTLRFLGEVGDAEVPRLLSGFADFSPGIEAPRFLPAKLSLLPDARRPRLLALDLEPEHREATDALVRDLGNFLAARGIPPESGHWRAHVTLCRFRGQGRLPGGVLETLDPSDRELPIRAASIDLMESELRRGGAVYRSLRRHGFRYTMPPMEYAVITVIGPDTIGIMDRLADTVASSGANIEETKAAILGGEFAVIMLVSGPAGLSASLDGSLPRALGGMGLSIAVKPTVGPAKGKGLSYVIESVSLDTPGIVRAVTGVLKSGGINIEEMESSVQSAPLSGSPMFSMRIGITIAPGARLATLRRDLDRVAAEHDLDISLRALKPAEAG